MPLFLLFFGVPLLELWLLFGVADRIGGWATLGLVIVTAAVGSVLVRRQGVETLRRAQQKMDSGELPASELFAGLCLLVSGVMLVTPGILTDIVGFCLLVPGVRHWLMKPLLKVVSRNGSFRFHSHHSQHSRHSHHSGDNVYEGEFHRESEASKNESSNGRLPHDHKDD